MVSADPCQCPTLTSHTKEYRQYRATFSLGPIGFLLISFSSEVSFMKEIDRVVLKNGKKLLAQRNLDSPRQSVFYH